MPTRIEDVAEIAEFIHPLRALGYHSVEQLLGTAGAVPDALANYLQVTPADLQSRLSTVPSRTGATVPRTPQRKFALGARLDHIPHPSVALMGAPGAVDALPSLVNLISQMRPIRDQGEYRGTCVAHSSTAAVEQYLGARGQTLDLSREFLFWDCKQHDGYPNDDSTWVSVAMARLVADGCCLETTWPYVMTPIVGNVSQDPPPPEAATEASKYKIPTFRQMSPTSVGDIRTELAQGRCVAFSIAVFNSWYRNDEVTRTGDIINPIPGEAVIEGHSMCFVGYQDDPADSASGGGRFYLRNSWGPFWATEPTVGTIGYGTIPYSYISAYCTEAYSIA